MHKTQIVMVTLYILFPMFGDLQAHDLAELLQGIDSSLVQKIREGEILTHVKQSSSDRQLTFLPRHSTTQNIRSTIEATNPSIFYEILFYLENSTVKEKMAERKNSIQPSQYVDKNMNMHQTAYMLYLMNQLRNIEPFARISYRNLKNGQINPLFNTSIRIQSADNKLKIPVLAPLSTVSEQKKEDLSFVLQNMPPFGDVVSEYRYVYQQDLLYFLGQNLSYILYKGFAVVRPKDMRMICFIFRTEDGVLVYGLGSVRVSGFAFFFKKVIQNSFSSRMQGFFQWINTR